MAPPLASPPPGVTPAQVWHFLRRHRWLLLGTIFGFWLAAVVVGRLLPARYRSQALVLIEQPQVPKDYVVPSVTASEQERLQSMTEEILSRTQLQQIMAQHRLYAGSRAPLDQRVARMRSAIQIQLVQAPVRDPEGNNVTAFRVYFSASDPHVAQVVDSQIAALFIEANQRQRQRSAQATSSFLASQLQQAAGELQAQEQQVSAFKTRYLGQLPSQMQSNVQILQGLQTQLQGANEALNRAQQQKLYFDSLLGDYRSLLNVPGGGGPNLPTALDQKLGLLETQLAELRTRYTERHPDVQRVEQEIAETKQLRDQALRAPASAGGVGAGATSTADLQTMSPMMQIQSQIQANRLEIQNRQTQIATLGKKIASYQDRLNLTPMREQELAALTRNYEQSKTAYDSLLTKRDQSELATNLERQRHGEQFRLLDAATLPLRPDSPPRLLLSGLGLLIGLLVGLGVALLREVADDRLHGEQQLKGLLPAPVLVAIPTLRTRHERHRHGWALAGQWLTATILVLVVVGGNFWLYLHS